MIDNATLSSIKIELNSWKSTEGNSAVSKSNIQRGRREKKRKRKRKDEKLSPKLIFTYSISNEFNQNEQMTREN